MTAQTAQGTRLSGRILDENSQPLPFAIVYVSGTSNGTTANGEGYYSLDLEPGPYEISFRMIGYALLKRQIEIGNMPMQLDVRMSLESISISEVLIRASAEDPAYSIIREAQKKRKYYRDQVNLFSANAYVKSTQRLVSHPKKILGQEVNVEEFLDTTTKIFYLSESVSELSFKAPSNYKEKMISSKVSGSPRSYSFNQSTDVLINFYESLVNISGLTPRGIVSPVAGNSIFYYKFAMEGTFIENGVLVNKIKVTPKRPNDPAFTGTIYISDSTWRIYSLDLYITQAQQMEFVDTFRIKQNYIRVDEETWMPFSNQFEYGFSFLGFKGDGIVLGIFSDYNLNPNLPDNYFNAEIMKVEADANRKDSVYWNEVRPVPLTELESTDYRRKDSTRIIHESKEYLDSIDKKANKFTFNSALTGYSWQNSFENQQVSLITPFQRIFFNTVEGWNIASELAYTKDFGKDDRREYTITASGRYGFSNRHANGKLAYENHYNMRSRAIFSAEGGTEVLQINNHNPIGETINTLYSLLAEKNYMKLYERQFVSVSHRSDLFNGFRLNVSLSFAHRDALTNTTTYKFHNVENRDYLSNDPYHPQTDSLRFQSHNALAAEMHLSIRPGQKYIDRPEGKFIVASSWPVFQVSYRKGIHAIGSDINYDLMQLSLNDEIRLGLFGHLKYMIVYGDFLSTKKLFAPDLKHFSGNKTWFSDFRLNDFKNLDYYTYSTTGSYAEVHAEENFGGFFLNKIPLIRKLKLQEIAGVHFLHTEALDQYFEFSLGFEKLGLIRAELFTSLTDGRKGTVGFLIGIKRILG